MAIQLRVPQLDEGMLQSGGNAMATTGLTHTVRGMYVPAIDAYAGVTQVAKQVAGMGDAFFKFAVEQEKIKQQAEAQHGLNEMQNQLSKAYTDYSLLEGQNAIDGYDKYQETVNKIKQNTFSTYDRTNFIQRAVQSRGEEITSQFQQQGYAHQAKETVKWRDAENQAAIDKAASDALTFFNDPVLSAEAWNRWEKHVGIYLYNKGIDANSDIGKQTMTKFRTDALSSLVEYSIGTKQYGAAQTQLQQYKEKLSGEDYITLLTRLKSAQIADAEQASRHAQVLRSQELTQAMQALEMARHNKDLQGIQNAQAVINGIIGNTPQTALEFVQKNTANYAPTDLLVQQYKSMTRNDREAQGDVVLAFLNKAFTNGDINESQYQFSLNEILKQQDSDYSEAGRNGFTQEQLVKVTQDCEQQSWIEAYAARNNIDLSDKMLQKDKFIDAVQKFAAEEIKNNTPLVQMIRLNTEAGVNRANESYKLQHTQNGKIAGALIMQLDAIMPSQIDTSRDIINQMPNEWKVAYNSLPKATQELVKNEVTSRYVRDMNVTDPNSFERVKDIIDNSPTLTPASLSEEIARAHVSIADRDKLVNHYTAVQGKKQSKQYDQAVSDYRNTLVSAVGQSALKKSGAREAISEAVDTYMIVLNEKLKLTNGNLLQAQILALGDSRVARNSEIKDKIEQYVDLFD